MKKIGVLALQGGVDEHIHALLSSSEKLAAPAKVVEVRLPEDMENIDGLIIPGGESTALSKLMSRAGIFEPAQNIRKIMGTCAGAILMAKRADGIIPGQKTLSLMDITISRNAYGPQLASFEADLTSVLGNFRGVFIRAPKIASFEKGVQPMAFHGDDPVALYQKKTDIGGERHYLALTFHPELTTTKFHEFFLKL